MSNLFTVKSKVKPMRKLVTPQGWFILVMFLLLSFAGEAQTQNKPKNYCTAVKADNTPCKMTVKTAGSKCYHHSETTIRCGANTTSNKPCRMSVKTNGEKCWRHKQ